MGVSGWGGRGEKTLLYMHMYMSPVVNSSFGSLPREPRDIVVCREDSIDLHLRLGYNAPKYTFKLHSCSLR